MDFKGYRYSVIARVVLTGAELNRLMEVSRDHYDGKCRSISEPGRGAFLYGMMCGFHAHLAPEGTGLEDIPDGRTPAPPEHLGATCTFFLEVDQLDTLAKVSEMEVYAHHDDSFMGLNFALRRILTQANTESIRLNEPDRLAERAEETGFASFSTKCPRCRIDGELVVKTAVLVATSERIDVGSPLSADGFEVSTECKDASTQDEVVRCEACRSEFPLSEVTL